MRAGDRRGLGLRLSDGGFERRWGKREEGSQTGGGQGGGFPPTCRPGRVIPAAWAGLETQTPRHSPFVEADQRGIAGEAAQHQPAGRGEAHPLAIMACIMRYLSKCLARENCVWQAAHKE